MANFFGIEVNTNIVFFKIKIIMFYGGINERENKNEK